MAFFFGAFGLLCLVSGTYGLGKETRTCIGTTSITRKRFWFSIPISCTVFERANIESIGIRHSGSMGGQHKSIEYYKLKILFKDGQDSVIGFGIDGLQRAELLATNLSELTGLHYSGKAGSLIQRRKQARKS